MIIEAGTLRRAGKTIGSVHVTTGIMDCGNLIKMTDDYANMKTDEMNALNAFGYIGMSLM